MELKDELAQVTFLEGVLKANIISFAKGIKWDIHKVINLRIDSIPLVRMVSYKGARLMGLMLNSEPMSFYLILLALAKGKFRFWYSNSNQLCTLVCSLSKSGE